MKRVELENILKMHRIWLATGGIEGCRADFCDADLRGANLSKADLRGADFRGANLCGAYLREANLFGANLSMANLSMANLSRADFCEANLSVTNLSMANLCGANFSEANLCGANLWRARIHQTKNISYPQACPEEGAFIGFKKVSGDYIVKLEIPEDAQRSSATGRKCRCSKAKVLSITTLGGHESDVMEVASMWDANFIYRVGETVEVPDFEPDRWLECAPGIHFFITRQEAVEY